MDPRRLELLLELSRLGSMRAVAETMHVTTSTVSQQIAALAREAGTPLIEPDGRRVRLTPAGRRLADHAVTILAAVEAARLDLDPSAAPAGIVRVGVVRHRRPAASCCPSPGSSPREHPEVRLHIHEHEPAEALALLASRRHRPRADLRLQPRAGQRSTAAWSATPLWQHRGGVSGCRPAPAADAGPRRGLRPVP